MESAVHRAIVGRSHTLKETPKLMSSMAEPTPLAMPARHEEQVRPKAPSSTAFPAMHKSVAQATETCRNHAVATDVLGRVEELASLLQKHGIQQ